MKVDPIQGTDDPPTNSTVTPTQGKEDFSGDIAGIETGDSVNVGKMAGREPDDPAPGEGPAKDPVNVTGTGGTVIIGPGSNVNVKNEAPSGGASIQVQLPGNQLVEVPPGATVPFRT